MAMAMRVIKTGDVGGGRRERLAGAVYAFDGDIGVVVWGRELGWCKTRRDYEAPERITQEIGQQQPRDMQTKK